MKKFKYFARIIPVYFGARQSQLTFWHEKPKANTDARFENLGPYYMEFQKKANYPGPFDKQGVPKLNYHGKIGLQYNPIAIAQFGLAQLNLYYKNKNKTNLRKACHQADWLVKNLEKNKFGYLVWMHHFDWEYRETLRAPWYSALAQGCGLSLLARIYRITKEKKYLVAAENAFESFKQDIKEGGVTYKDEMGDIWFEEVIVSPPTHILNGFLWALWGVYDYWLLTKKPGAKRIFDSAVLTLKKNLQIFDSKFWSLYEIAGLPLPMVASFYYHSLHITQLRITAQLTGFKIFLKYAKKWHGYEKRFSFKAIAFFIKSIFKLVYY